jgi:hypothetical protein
MNNSNNSNNLLNALITDSMVSGKYTDEELSLKIAKKLENEVSKKTESERFINLSGTTFGDNFSESAILIDKYLSKKPDQKSRVDPYASDFIDSISSVNEKELSDSSEGEICKAFGSISEVIDEDFLGGETTNNNSVDYETVEVEKPKSVFNYVFGFFK